MRKATVFPDDTKKKAVVYVFLVGTVQLFIPRQRGEGYLRVPVGHHRSKLSQFIEELPGVAYTCGLDGCVEIYFHDSLHTADRKAQVIEEVIVPIADRLGYSHREAAVTDKEFK